MRQFAVCCLFLSLFSAPFGLVGSGYAQSDAIGYYSSKYKEDLEKYRQASDVVSIALTQYANLKTLSSQEEAVQAMRNFLLIRADAVSAHLALVREVLVSRPAVNPEWTATVSGQLEKELADLSAHHTRSDVAVDRIRADQEALWFQTSEKKMLIASDRAACLIAMGRARESIVALESVKQKIDRWISIADMSETQKVEKKRGSDELGRAIVAAQSTLAQAQDLYRQNAVNSFDVALYPRLRPVVLASYTQVLRGVEYAKELTR